MDLDVLARRATPDDKAARVAESDELRNQRAWQPTAIVDYQSRRSMGAQPALAHATSRETRLCRLTQGYFDLNAQKLRLHDEFT